MRIVERYSHLNGLEFLLVHQPALWEEIQQVIRSVDPTKMKTKRSKERTMKGKMLYSPKAMNVVIKDGLEAHGWMQSRTDYWVTRDAKLIRKTIGMNPDEQRRTIENAEQEAISSYNQTDFVKNRVAVEVQFGKYAFVAFDLFVKHLAFYVGDIIDIGVEILPMKSLQAEMSSGPSYYERELYNLIREGRGVPGVPLVLLGIAP